MSATALAPAPAPGLAAPAGPWKKLSAAMTAEVPAIAGRPVLGAIPSEPVSAGWRRSA
jgi:hypothetical protein